MAVATEVLKPLTIGDLEDYPDDGMRREVITGELVVTPAPTPVHQIIIGRLFRMIGNFVEEHDLGLAMTSPVDVRLTVNDVVEPDIVYVARERSSLLAGKFIDGIPDLVVEVLSPDTRRTDLVRKHALYARAGIAEYWVADPERQTLTILRLEEGRYVALTAKDGLLLSSVLVGLRIDPVKLFAGIPE